MHATPSVTMPALLRPKTARSGFPDVHRFGIDVRLDVDRVGGWRAEGCDRRNHDADCDCYAAERPQTDIDDGRFGQRTVQRLDRAGHADRMSIV